MELRKTLKRGLGKIRNHEMKGKLTAVAWAHRPVNSCKQNATDGGTHGPDETYDINVWNPLTGWEPMLRGHCYGSMLLIATNFLDRRPPALNNTGLSFY